MKKFTRMICQLLPLVLLTVLATASAQAQERYSYDDLGRITNVAYPDGSSLAYTYDAAGNILSISAVTTSVATGAGELDGVLQASVRTGSDGAVVVSVRSGSAGQVLLEVVDVQGRVLATEEVGARIGEELRFAFNGATDTGEPVASGLYLFRLTLHDVQGAVATTTVRASLVR